MVSLAPIVVETRTAQEFLRHVLDHHAPPSTLIICSSKADFLQSLQPSNGTDATVDGRDDSEDEQRSAEESPAEQTEHFAPTLRLLSTSRTLKLAFCPDITHLRAYLACLCTDNSNDSTQEHEKDGALRMPDAVPTLAILNPIELHRPTSAFSAQGLNRSFSIAIDAAYRNRLKLVLAETVSQTWDEELSILNVTNKRLGDLAVGRTVTAKAVAERWCSFEWQVL